MGAAKDQGSTIQGHQEPQIDDVHRAPLDARNVETLQQGKWASRDLTKRSMH